MVRYGFVWGVWFWNLLLNGIQTFFPPSDVIFCRCHDGAFDPYDVVKNSMQDGSEYSGAKVVAGPPPRAAPLIPIEIKDGKVVGVPEKLGIYDYCG